VSVHTAGDPVRHLPITGSSFPWPAAPCGLEEAVKRKDPKARDRPARSDLAHKARPRIPGSGMAKRRVQEPRGWQGQEVLLRLNRGIRSDVTISPYVAAIRERIGGVAYVYVPLPRQALEE
jgi:hypothetical protein